MHRAFAATRGDTSLLVVYVDGDGTPWTHGWHSCGSSEGCWRIASDPTPSVPLALRLALLTPESVLYLGRPCYFGLQQQAGCSPALWTSERYSEAVVASMAAAATAYASQHHFEKMLLVGYSGGGTIVTLMAPRVPRVVGVVTVAGNLDTDAWTQAHDGYLPLTGSLNPARQPPLPAHVPEWHLVGDRDTNVPYAAAQAYLRRVPPDHVWHYPNFDHRCCWEREWPSILSRLHAELGLPGNR